MTATRTTDRHGTVRTRTAWTRGLTRAVLVTAMAAALAGVGVITTAAPAGAAGGELLSVATFGGTDFDQGRAIAVDAAGNTFTTGYFEGTVDFDPGPGTDNRTSAGGSDVYVTKLGPDGSHQWTATFGGTGNDMGRAIAVDPAGNVHTTGVFEGTVDFDPGPGSDSRSSNGERDVFVGRLDTSGAHQWIATFGGVGSDWGNGIALDGVGNVHVTGWFNLTVDFDPGPGTDNRTSAGGSDVYVTKLDANGIRQWSTTFGGASFDEGSGVAVDGAGNVHIIGNFEGTVDFDPGPGTDNRVSNGGFDVFVTSLSPTGAHQWAATFGGTSTDVGAGVAVDAAGNVHTTGRFRSTVDFDPGPGTDNRTSSGDSDAFVTKLGPTGTHQWAAVFGGISLVESFGIAVDTSGNVHTTGTFAGTADFDPGPGTDNRTSNGSFDAFVTKLDAAGTHRWTATFGGTSLDLGFGIAVAGNVHSTGWFNSTADFDPGPGATNRTSNGFDDAFIVALAAKGVCNGLLVTVDLAAGDTPTSGDDVIAGTPGPDTISGGGGDDTICGGAGDDTISGGPGNDIIGGEAGNDTIYGADGNDTIAGGDGNDTILGNNGTDEIDGDAGNDTISGNDGGDLIRSGPGTNTVFGGAGDDFISGGDGDDTMLGGSGFDFIAGNAGDDLISGNAGDDTIRGGDDNDTLYGVDGSDTITGGNAGDIILGGTDNDFIDGEDGDDRLAGNAGNDIIFGGNENDELYGGAGNDELDAGSGNDLALGGGDDDFIDGGDGSDLLSGNDGDDTVFGGFGDDEVYGADGNDTLTGDFGNDIILGGNNNDTINSQDGEADQVSGNNGTDTCTRDPGIDNVFACESLIP